MQKKLLAILGIVVALAVVLGACTAAPQTAVPTEAATVAATEAATQAPTETVEDPATRKGAWLDSIVMIAEPSVESAVARILADDIDIYAQSAEDPEAFATVQDEGLKYVNTVGSYKEITFNPVFNLNDGTINPFGLAKVREAMNKLVDRNYIAQEIMGGLGLPKTVPLTGVFPDYANFAAVARELENKYAYNPEEAGTEIGAELEAVGATMVDGKWNYDGAPITVIFLIRTEDKRMQIGDYIANQLEEYAGLTVDRQYKTSSEASPLWLQSDPADGQWHLYTGGWITTAIDRNQTTLLGDFYTYLGWPGNPLWNAYETTDEFFSIADALYNSNYTSVQERYDLFARGLVLALENSNRIWLVDDLSFSPMAPNVSVTYDLASGVSGTPLYAHTLRFDDVPVGGEMVYAMGDLLVDPWNPLGGSNWIYDSAAQRATGDFGIIPDPYTGLSLPQRIESASIVAEEGLPIGITYDWLTLDFQPEIVVPDDTWMDWDAANQVFITAAENLGVLAEKAAADEASALAAITDAETALTDAQLAFDEAEAALADLPADATEEETTAAQTAVDDAQAALDAATAGVPAAEDAYAAAQEATVAANERTQFTAKVKSTVVYPADLFDTVTWHDGSPFSVADIVMGLILQFDPGMADSEIYDEAQVAPLASFMTSFKGVRIASMDPLTIEYYTDNWQLDAENNVTSLYPGSWYPFGEGSWDMMALGYMAERDSELAFTADKAEALDVEYMSFISGPSLEVLKAKLDQAVSETFIPYEPTLGQYITTDEAAARYSNMSAWYDAHSHFWVGTGPFYLDKVFAVEKTLTLTHYKDYPDLASKWSGFGEPKIADVEVDGPARVTIGEEATFSAYVTFKGEAYASADITDVKYLVFDATGALIDSGSATMAAEGQYDVTLSADLTSGLAAGSNKIEMIVVPLVVSVPTFSDFEFVTAE